ncbi:MAG: zinc ribbon domain-containing protein [candidate division WOR-3 bacterium]
MENNLEILKAIESERNDLLNKLQKIEEKKSHVSHEVYVKVKSDYETKLKKLDERLAENKELVKAEMERSKVAMSELLQKQKELKLHLEEIELRYSIGEYSEDKFNELGSKAKDDLNNITGKINELENRIKWCKELIGIEKEEETPVMEEVAREEPEKKKEERAEELKIDEHILEETLPEEVRKLDELLVETDALLEPTEKKVSETSKKGKEEGISCPKCGFINPPDSWYCEKCGAEILTIN